MGDYVALSFHGRSPPETVSQDFCGMFRPTLKFITT